MGQPIRRLDGRQKVDGTELFGADVGPTEALLVRAVRSPHFHARFRFGDLDSWAAGVPGVQVVLTADDIPGENRFGVIPRLADQPALAEGSARFLGEDKTHGRCHLRGRRQRHGGQIFPRERSCRGYEKSVPSRTPST